ncbi:LysR family transcriptional regulator [Salipiger sp. P9]|uniref:LysR family transcriptional regulator n=1 Tax=Salipiger pentaromativorans TaxID=2943193 RepID=UPI00215729CE|nr:LysR family transcriptional regulator [Salipiger pentaromativorans]MCR8548272.1 LysR family transcriptional regulator [Salipiger pentaromativorans]
MDAVFHSLDWSLVRTYLGVAETGSLSEAARRLGLSQPTVGRQIRQMEAVLDVTLFQRQPRGLTLTETGAALLPHARAIRDSMQALNLAAAGRSERLAGTVRITASVMSAHFHLPPILARIRAREPEIAIDLVPTDQTENLLYREADIAVRMYLPDQLDIVMKHLGDLDMGIYAARSYLDRVGRPETLEALWRRDMVGLDRSDVMIRAMREMGVPATRDWFATRCDDFVTSYQLVRAGCGAGVLQCNLADRDAGLERLFPELPLPALPVYLAAHEAMRHTPRIRRVWDLLEQGLAPLFS